MYVITGEVMTGEVYIRHKRFEKCEQRSGHTRKNEGLHAKQQLFV